MSGRPPVERLMLQSKEPRSYADLLAPATLDSLPPCDVSADLHLPPNGGRRAGLLGAVVQLHGSFGWLSHHNKHRDTMVDAGLAVLQINSFASRGVESTAEKQVPTHSPTRHRPAPVRGPPTHTSVPPSLSRRAIALSQPVCCPPRAR